MLNMRLYTNSSEDEQCMLRHFDETVGCRKVREFLIHRDADR